MRNLGYGSSSGAAAKDKAVDGMDRVDSVDEHGQRWQDLRGFVDCGR